MTNLKPDQNTSTLLFLFFGMALFGSATPISKIVGQEFPVFTASLARVTLGSLSLLPFVAKDIRREVRNISGKDWLYLGLISLLGIFGFTVALLFGMRMVSGVAGSLVMSFQPAVTALGAWMFLGSAMDKKRMLAIGLGVAGILVISFFRQSFGGAQSDNFTLGLGLVLTAVCCEAGYTLIGKKVMEDVPPLVTSFLTAVVSIPLFAVLSASEWGQLNLQEIPSRAIWSLLFWGVATLGAGSALWYKGVSKSEGGTAAGFMAVMPVSALVLSYFLLGEAFQWMHLIGIALVGSSVVLMSRAHMQH